MTKKIAVLVLGLSGLCRAGNAGLQVRIAVDRARVGMGRVVEVTALAARNGAPVPNCELLPYVDDRRWGAHKKSDAAGKARFLLPMPRPGIHEIRVQALPPGLEERTASWIWHRTLRDHQTVFLWTAFPLHAPVQRARLWLAVDDSATVFLNGRSVAGKGGWHGVKPVALEPAFFRVGQNLLAVEAHNGVGPAGILIRLEIETPAGPRLVVSNDSWQAAEAPGKQWPKTPPPGTPVRMLGAVYRHFPAPDHWPGLGKCNIINTGTRLPPDAVVSNPVQVRVDWRRLETMPHDPDHLIGMQWEPWFTPQAVFWQTAEAVPVMGFYLSYDRDVIRQHLIWLEESGVDFLFADWSNHIWFLDDWRKRGAGTNTIILATTLTLEVMAEMRDEGLPTPKLMLLTGISHAKNGVRAVNGELDWIYNNYVRNPRFRGLYQELYGKPLVTPLDLGAKFLKTRQPVDPAGHFTIRYVGAQQDRSHTDKLGLWSWMDCGTPQITYFKGKPEAVTVSLGCFCSRGWTAPTARGHRGGATLLETMAPALAAHPRVMLIHQFNEFAGQAEGQGHGPHHDEYYDTYNAELTDDCEPTALDAPGYRSPEGGWGFYYLNLVRAVVDLYKQSKPETTVVVVSRPLRRRRVAGPTLEVRWKFIGRRPKEYTLWLDGRPVRRRLHGDRTTLDIRNLAPGPHRLKLVAEGTTAHYRLAWRHAARRLKAPEPAAVTVEFIKTAEKH